MKASEVLKGLEPEMLQDSLYQLVERLSEGIDVGRDEVEDEIDLELGDKFYQWTEIAGALASDYPAYEDILFRYKELLRNLNVSDEEIEAGLAGFLAGLVIVKDCVELLELQEIVSIDN